MEQRVALLVNFIPPYRLPVFEALAEQVGELRIFISTPMGVDRPWPIDWGKLDVTVQRGWTLTRKQHHSHGFSEVLQVHIPGDTLWLLAAYRPHVVISSELGLRTLQAMTYRAIDRKSRLIVWATLSEYSEQDRGWLRERLRRWVLPRVDAVMVNGESGARYVKRFGAADDRIIHVPYATDTNIFSSSPERRDGASRHGRRLLYVGQLIERKGLAPFTSVLSRWAADHPDLPVEFRLAGDGPLRRSLEQLRVPPNLSIHVLGDVPFAQLPRVYAEAGIFVFPTLADEWGLVVNEAMVSGRPVLGSVYSQAVEELVRDGEHGWTFRPDRAEETYAALDRACSTPADVLDGIGEAARERVRHLTPELVADRILQAIRDVR